MALSSSFTPKPPTPPPRHRPPPRPVTPDPAELKVHSNRQSRLSTNSSFFSHESHGPQTPRADAGLSLVICSDDQELHLNPEGRRKNSEEWWADLTPRIPQLGAPTRDGDVCIDDSPTLPEISRSLLRNFPRPPPPLSPIPLPPHPYLHPSGSYPKSGSTETLHAESTRLPIRRFTPPQSKPPERPLPLDPEKLAEVNRALRELGLQELASASIRSPPISPRNSIGSQVRRPSTPSNSSLPPVPASPLASDNASVKSSKSSKSSKSAISVAPSIPSRTSSRRTPKISSRASSLKLIRSPYGEPIEVLPFPRSTSSPFGFSRSTPSPDHYSSSSIASPISVKSLLRTPRSSYRNPSIRSVSTTLPSIYETPRDIDLVPSGNWALRERSPYRIYGASKSQPDIFRGRDMSIRQSLKYRYQGGSPPLDGSSFIHLNGSSSLWRASPSEKNPGLPWEERLALLRNRLLLSTGEVDSFRTTPTRPSSRPSEAADLFSSPEANFPPQIDFSEPAENEESLLDDVRALVEAKGWSWPEPPSGETEEDEEDIQSEAEDRPSTTGEVLLSMEHSHEMASSSPATFTAPALIARSSASTNSQEPSTPSQTHASTLSSPSLPHTPSTTRSASRSFRVPVAALDLSEEIDAIDQAELDRIAAEEKEKAIANGTYVDLTAPRTKSIGFAAPSESSEVESAPSIHKAKIKKEAFTPTPPSETKEKGGLKFMKSFRKVPKI